MTSLRPFRSRVRIWSRSAPLRAVGFFAVAFVAYRLLSRGESASNPQAREILGSLQWSTWKAIAALAIAVGITSAVMAMATIRQLMSDPPEAGIGRAPAPLSKLAEPIGHSVRLRAVLGYALVAVVFLVGVFVLLEQAPDTHEWPNGVPAHNAWYTSVIIGVCGIPWLVLVWVLQHHLTTMCESDAISTAELRKLWDFLNAIVFAFAVFVVLALITTGALRAAYFAGPKDPAQDKQGPEFPSTDVLTYGAYFAILLTAIALPMVLAYRAAARRKVAQSVNLDVGLAELKNTKEGLDALEGLLHLDVGVLRSPVTSLAVFTPLITAALAAYVPALAS